MNPPGSPAAAPANASGTPDPTTTAATGAGVRAQEARAKASKSDTITAAEARAVEEHLGLGAVSGDVVFGNKTEVRYEVRFGAAGSTFRGYRVASEERDLAFVAPEGFSDLQRASDGQLSVVLCGPAGYGKYAAMLRLLTGGNSEIDVRRLDREIDLSKLKREEVPEGAVLLLDDLPAQRLSTLMDYEIPAFIDLMRGRCRLGVTTTAVGADLTSSSGCVVLRLTHRPEPREVFDRHMDRRMVGQMAEWRVMRGRPDLRDFLGERLDGRPTLSLAAQLARQVALLVHDPESAVAKLRRAFGDEDEECAKWFRELGDIKANCFAVALAVLDGMPRETVARAAEDLEHRVAPTPGAVIAPPQAPNPFAVAAVVSPARLKAEVVSQTRTTPLGDMREQVIKYVSTRYAGLVLLHVWREHDWIRPAALAWLSGLGRSTDARVRVRAATAVGFLGRQSLEVVVAAVIDKWAHEDNDDSQDCAAVALGPPLKDPLLANAVRALVTGWSRARVDENDVPLRATAARAYGSTIGSRNPTAALRELAKLADDEDFDVLYAVARSYRELALESTPALSVRVLREVNRLVADRKQERRLAGALTCMDLALRHGGPIGAGDTISRPAWPSMVALAAGRPETEPLLAELLARGLSDGAAGVPIGAAVDEWATAAERDSELGSSVVALLAAAAAVDQRSALNVYRRAQRWTARGGKAPVTGQSLLRRFA